MSNLILVRHGEAEHHTKGMTGGWTDTPLTNRGRQQSECLGRALALLLRGQRARFYSSDLLRARQTAERIAAECRIEPVFAADLRELNNGAAKDKTAAQAERLALPKTEPLADWVPYPGAESWRAMARRATAFMERTARESEGHTLLVLSHGNPLVAMVHWWLRLPEDSPISYDFDCASISRLSANEWGERVIVKLNDTSHLKG